MIRSLPLLLLMVVAVTSLALGGEEKDTSAKDRPHGLEVIVVDQEGEPVVDATLLLYGAKGRRAHGHEEAVRTDARGRYLFTRVARTLRYHVRAVKKGYAWALSGERLPHEGSVRIALETARARKGRVLDGEGKPVFGAWLTLDLPEPPHQDLVSTRTNGSFELAPLGSSKGRLFVTWLRKDGDIQRQRGVTLDGVGASDEDLTIRLGEGLTISGTVTFDLGGQAPRVGVQAVPVGEAGRDVLLHGGFCAADIEPDGTFRIDGLKPGRYRLRRWSTVNSYSGPGLPQVRGNVTEKAGAKDVELVMVRPK